MKIAFFDWFTHMGGAQKSTTEFMERIVDQYEIHFLDAYGAIPMHRERLLASGIRYVTLLPGAWITTRGASSSRFRRAVLTICAIPELIVIVRRLRKWLIENKPSDVFVIAPNPLRLLLWASRGLDLRIHYWCRGQQLPEIIHRKEWLCRISSFVFFSGPIQKTEVKKGIPHQKTSIISNAIVIDDYRKLAERPLSQPLPGTEKELRLFLPATLLPGKGQDCAIRTVSRLVESGHDTMLWLAGDTAQTGGDYKNGLEQLIQELGLQKNVALLGWRDDVPQIMNHCSALVFPTKNEGFGRCILEAISLGKPVFASSVGSIPEILDYGNAGWLFPIDDDYQLAQQIHSTFQDMSKVEKRVRASQKIVMDRYTPSAQVKAFDEHMNQAMERSNDL